MPARFGKSGTGAGRANESAGRIAVLFALPRS